MKKLLSFTGIISMSILGLFTFTSPALAGAQHIDENLVQFSSTDLQYAIGYQLPVDYDYMPTKEDMLKLEYLDSEMLSPYPNIYGLENAHNLNTLTGEHSLPLLDISPLKNLTLLKEFTNYIVSNQMNLEDLKNLNNLEYLILWSDGCGARTPEELNENLTKKGDNNLEYSKALLTDISDLSNCKKLKKIAINTEGIMAPVTLRKGTTEYNLYDPIILSSQFDGVQPDYCTEINGNYSDSNDNLQWKDLKGTEKHLSFSWTVEKGNYYFTGDGQIPIRWK